MSWAAPLAARGRALVAAADGELEAAISLLAEAVADEVLVPLPLERARTRLVLGRVLRRAKRKAAAREMLESALAAFESLEAGLWSTQTSAELARISGRAAPAGMLTTSEQRIAELVAAGKSNRDVAASLFVTVHTVEAALTRVYRKLGVRSRTQLAHRLSHVTPKL